MSERARQGARQQAGSVSDPALATARPLRARERRLSVNRPGDRWEREAERAATAVMHGSGSPARGLSPVTGVQREEKAKDPNEEQLKAAAGKAAEAFLGTELGKQIKDKIIALGKGFVSTLPGAVVTGAIAVGAIAGMAAKNEELPIQVPEIPLDVLVPGLKVQLTYEGPVRNPTKASITFSGTFGQGANNSGKPKQTDAEKYRAETARLAAEQAKFREGLKTPAERSADQKFVDDYLRLKMNDPLNPLALPFRKEEPLQREAAADAAAGETAGHDTAPPLVHQTLAEAGQPLEHATRAFMEQRFGHDFSRVRIHTGARAADSARAIDANAYTHGQDIVFAAGRYAPYSAEGRRLLAHELAHVVQQGAAGTSCLQRSYGAQTPDAEATQEPRMPQLEPAEGEDAPSIQRDDTPAQAPPAAAAAPTLALSPGKTLTRGQTLNATVSFKPAGGEKLTATGWSYTTASDTVTRPAKDADFQTGWSGTMALSGALELRYTITPAGGTPGAEATVKEDIVVNDRSGAPWASTVTENKELDFTEQPSPPQKFNQLGRHNAGAKPLPGPKSSAITSGPNSGFTFVDTLTAGTFTSQPLIHPDIKKDSSSFWKFHQNPSRLYLKESEAKRTLIPPADYSKLSTAGSLSFEVTDWEAFYKKHSFYTITAESGGKTAKVPDSAWALKENKQAADLKIVDAAAIRTALKIGATDAFTTAVATRGSWQGFQLLESSKIRDGTRSHEYGHATHSHRANFLKMMRALDPQRKIEAKVGTPNAKVDFNKQIKEWFDEILKPNHELVDEKASRDQELFVAASGTMAGVNEDPASGALLGSVWNITGDAQMNN